MAVDMYIKLGDIKGEATGRGHKDEIDVLSWSWGMDQPAQATRGGAGKVSVQDLHFTKYIDKATVKLMARCATGDLVDEAWLTLQRGDKSTSDFYKIRLTDVIISSISTGGASGDDVQTETVSLNFAKVVVQYTEAGEDGGAGPTGEFGWDLTTKQRK